MKTAIALYCLVLMSLASAQTFRVGAEGRSWTFSGYGERKRFDYSFDTPRLAATPEWKSDQENPPLSPRKAEKLAMMKIQALLKKSKCWHRAEIVLQDSGDERHWFYVIKYDRDGGSVPQPVSMVVVVLMDGTIPEPKLLDMP